MPTYLLDTSAIRSAAGRCLGEIAKVAKLTASPFAFWEIASHLRDDHDFYRIKANLMKFKYIQIQDDPTAAAEQEFALAQPPGGESLETPDVIYAALAALRASKSVKQFYQCRIQDAQGADRQIDGCVTRIQAARAEGESRFLSFMTNVKDFLHNQRHSFIMPLDFHNGTLDLINGWWLQIKDRTDGLDDTYRKVVRRGYFFYYTNDFEDAKLLLHLTLDDDVTVVTSDCDLHKCLENTIKTLNGLEDDWFNTNINVLKTQDFLAK